MIESSTDISSEMNIMEAELKKVEVYVSRIARGHSITKHTVGGGGGGGEGWLEGLSQKPQNIYPKLAILGKC